MISLKAFLPYIAKVLGQSTHALHARQRALVAGGVLAASGTRGRGNGLLTSPEILATLVLSLMATDSHLESAEITRRVCDLKRVPTKPSRKISASKTLHDLVVAELLQEIDEEPNAKLSFQLQLDRRSEIASVILVNGERVNFGEERGPWHNIGLWQMSVLSMPTIWELGRVFREASKEREQK